MRRLFLFAAVLAVAGFTFVSSIRADNTAKSDQPVDRVGDRVSDAVKNNPMPAKDADDIRKTLQTVTEAAVTKGGFDDVVERFVDADRNRLGKSGIVEKDQPTLDGRVAQFQKDWKAKYNQDFNIKDRGLVFNETFAMIRQGEIPEGARLAGEREGVAGGDTNKEPGRNVAIVVIPASHGLPELHLPMIHEAIDSWKIDIPDDLTAEQLRDNILTHLTMCDEAKDQWPSDPNDAYRAVTHHILAACLNAPIQKDQTTPPQPDMPQNPR